MASWWPLPLTAMASGSTTFQSSSTRYSSALASASLAWAKTASTVSASSSSSSPLTILRASAIIRSSPSSP